MTDDYKETDTTLTWMFIISFAVFFFTGGYILGNDKLLLRIISEINPIVGQFHANIVYIFFVGAAIFVCLSIIGFYFEGAKK